MKNILIVVPNDILGGAEQYLKMVATQFLKDGNSVYVFFLKKNRTESWSSITNSNNLKTYDTNSSKERYGIFGLLRNLIKHRKVSFEYAFTSHVHCTGIVGVLRKIGITKINYFIARESTSIFKRFTGIRLLRFKIHYFLGYTSVDLLICQTALMKDQLLKALPWIEKKIQVKTISNPIDIPSINCSNNKGIIENINYTYIVSAGRLIWEKGYDILIYAFNKLILDYPDIKLIILGDGHLHQFLETIIIENNLSNSVHLMGYKHNVYPYFKNAKMCVVPSRIEGFPNVLLQMMSQNTKIVSTTCAGGIDKITGVYTCPPENINRLYESMKQCLSNNTDSNRKSFDDELNNRSIDKFIKIVTKSVKQDKHKTLNTE